MAFKIFKVIWVLSLMAVLASLFYVYASLPEKVVVNESAGNFSLGREQLFYLVLAVLALVNASVFAVTRIYPEEADLFKAWYYGLVLFTNLFFIVALSFISLYNSAEKFDYPRIGPIIYGSLLLLIGWAMAWPFYRLVTGLFKKPTS
ncbi:MAG: hypothetical protein JSS93_01925 [Bacteroidetes bacterium]|nr:hypothetical protein [Bacteroidota bacterium]